MSLELRTRIFQELDALVLIDPHTHIDSFDPATSYGAWLHRDLTACGFEVWFDRIAMPSRGLPFHQEIQDAVAARERSLLVVGQGMRLR